MGERRQTDELQAEDVAPASDLDATGITVTITDTDHRDRFGGGWPMHTIPLGGGRIDVGGLSVEVRPAVDVPVGSWRDYREIQQLCARAEHSGGFAWHGDEIWVYGKKGESPEVLVGRDAMKFLTELWRRASAREAAPDTATYEQGFKDGVGAAATEASEFLGALEMLRPNRPQQDP